MRRIVAAFALLFFFPTAALRASGLEPSALLTVSGHSIQPAGAPLILTLSVYNNGFSSIGYWCGGPGEFPDAADFTATITHKNGPVTLANGQRSGVGRMRWIVPGQVMRFPAALPPLAVGTYEITVRCEAYKPMQNGGIHAVIWPAMSTVKPLRVEIREDAALADVRDREIVAGVRAADPFSAFIAFTYPRPSVKSALADDLMSPSAITVERAMDGLWAEGVAEEADVPLVAKAIGQHLKPPDDGVDFAMMERLIKSISKERTPMAQGAVAKAAAARTGRVHEVAVSTLTTMRYPSSVRRRPSAQPPEEYDPEAIRALIKLAQSLGAPERKLAYTLLADYPKSPDAMEAIRAGTSDPDPEVQATVHQSLNRVTP